MLNALPMSVLPQTRFVSRSEALFRARPGSVAFEVISSVNDTIGGIVRAFRLSNPREM